jgi:ribulose-bisphosphate carboxylase large chain
VDLSFDAFVERVTACRDAVARANDQTGRSCLYFPFVGPPLPELERHLECVVQLGLRGVLMSPMILGLETTRAMAAKFPLALMAHPSLTGAFTSGPDHGIAQDVLLGTLFRLAGADISVFGNFGGRFRVSRDECLAIRDRLLLPLGHLEPSLPSPAGGMDFDRLADMSRDYGANAVFLLGGSLLAHSDLVASTQRFVARVEELAS